MGDFNRYFHYVENLKNEPLYKDKILPDIRKGRIFPALRGGTIEFYYKGGELFVYDGTKFTTHVKFAFTNVYSDVQHITEDEMLNLKAIPSFYDGYEEIKARCAKYVNVDALGVGDIIKSAGFEDSHSTIVLDIDPSFTRRDISKDKIDIVLYNPSKKEILFCEAKHYSNPKLWSTQTSDSKILAQLKRYTTWIYVNKNLILKQYTNSIDIYNQLFDLSLPYPESVVDTVKLFVFGFDPKQKDIIENLLSSDGGLKGIEHYSRHSIKGLSLDELYRQLKKI
ncbi:MAG: hypothetical protein ACRDA4_04300 [Filifactoraceae bacterium]